MPARGLDAAPSSSVDIVKLAGVEGGRRARGTVVIIDVLRSFTVSAYALDGGARECLLVPTVDEARTLSATIPGSLISAEENALPVAGISISNSPTQIRAADMRDRVLIQRSSAGTTVMAAVDSADEIYAASLVVARATVEVCASRRPQTLTLVASADHPEDHACAAYMEGLLRGESPDMDRLLEPLRRSDRYARVMSGDWPGFPPTDLELSLALDRFDFAMQVTRHASYQRLTAAGAVPRSG